MGQVSAKLRRGAAGYFHWCPGCEELHQLPDRWRFDGNLEGPTFHPSFKHSGMQTEKVDGVWTGAWVRDAEGEPVPFVCHYNLLGGKLMFCDDSTHALRGQTVPLPDLPEHHRD